MPDATTAPAVRSLLPELFVLLAAHRAACGQERPYQRMVALLLGWLCAFSRHTLTQVLLALGLGEADWTAGYRLFSRQRIDYERLTACLLRETLPLAPAEGPYLVAVDATQIPRHSRTMPGTSWLRHPGTAIFRRGIHRAQRFGHLGWLPRPTPTGYSRAVPLRFEPAFPAKAVAAASAPPRTEGEAGVAALAWGRQTLDAAGRAAQPLLALGDGSYSTATVWAGLPERVGLLARCAKNRALFALPTTQPARGRRRPRCLAGRAHGMAADGADGAGPAHPHPVSGGRPLPGPRRAGAAALSAGGQGLRSAPRQAAPTGPLLVGVGRGGRG